MPGGDVVDFRRDYAGAGRPSIPPERLLKGTLLMALYSVRNERQFCEQLSYNLLFRWFLDMDMVEPTFDATTFTKNRERLLAHDEAGEFFRAVVEQARKAHLMSEHFTVDGTLIDAWASLKSFKKKDAQDDDSSPPDDPGNPTVNFHGEKRSNETLASTTDPEAKLARKGRGKEAKLSYSAHALMENRNSLLLDFRIAEANGRAEREVALSMLDEHKTVRGPATVGADKGYDTHDFIAECRAMNIVPHVAQIINEHRGSAIDARTTRHLGMPSAKGFGSALRRSSAGRRPSAASAAPAIEVEAEPSSPPTWSARPTTSSGSVGSCQVHEMGAGATPHLSPTGATGGRTER